MRRVAAPAFAVALLACAGTPDDHRIVRDAESRAKKAAELVRKRRVGAYDLTKRAGPK